LSYARKVLIALELTIPAGSAGRQAPRPAWRVRRVPGSVRPARDAHNFAARFDSGPDASDTCLMETRPRNGISSAVASVHVAVTVFGRRRRVVVHGRRRERKRQARLCGQADLPQARWIGCRPDSLRHVAGRSCPPGKQRAQCSGGGGLVWRDDPGALNAPGYRPTRQTSSDRLCFITGLVGPLLCAWGVIPARGFHVAASPSRSFLRAFASLREFRRAFAEAHARHTRPAGRRFFPVAFRVSTTSLACRQTRS